MDYQGKKVWTGKNSKGETVVFFANFTAKNLKTGKTVSWKCEKVSQTVGTSVEMSKLTPDQQEYLNQLVANQGLLTKKPSTYEIEKGKWEEIDLNTMNPTLFPVQGTKVYKKTGEINKTTPQQDNIINSLITRGFKKETPKATESDLYTRVNLQTLESGKYSEYFKQPFYMWQPTQLTNVQDLLSNIEKTFDEQKVDKNQCGKTIDALYTAHIKDYGMNDETRIDLKNYAKRCAKQDLIPFFYKGKYEKLEYLNPATNKYSLNPRVTESKNLDESLQKLIKENLVEIKDIKKKSVVEEQIIQNRLSIICENRDLTTKEEQEKFAQELVEEIFNLNYQGFESELITEQVDTFFSNLLTNIPNALISTLFKEKAVKWIAEKLGVSGTWMTDVIAIAIGNINISDIGKLTDCNYLTKLISKSIVEFFVDKMKNKAGMTNPIFDIVRNALVDSLEQSSFGQKMEESLMSHICPIVGKLTSNIKKVSSDKDETKVETPKQEVDKSGGQ